MKRSYSKIFIAGGLLFLAAAAAIGFIFSSTAGLLGILLFACYALFCVLIVFLERRGSRNDRSTKSIAAHTFDFLTKLEDPVMLISSDDKLVWYNDAYARIYPGRKLSLGDNCADIDGGLITCREINGQGEARDFRKIIQKGERTYCAQAYPIETVNKSFQLVIWYDDTEFEALKRQMRDANVLVAYVVVDNISELTQGIQDKYRETSARIGTLLNEWALSLDGIIKEYERDKYLIFFAENKMEQLVTSKFDILDKVSALSDDNSAIPLTISIGVARITGTLSEKEKVAKQSLQLALQRGGAQAVVKNGEENEIYGGRTKTTQKRSKIKSRVIASELVAQIAKCSNVIVMAHRNPDYDSVGSCAGIARLTLYHGKRVNIVADPESPSVNTARGLLASIGEYGDIFADAVYCQDQITPDTLLVVVDVSNVDVFESKEIYQNVSNVAIIDHHRQVSEFEHEPTISYIEPTASSACELVSEILEYSLPPMTLNKEEAELMMAGILLDTQNYSRNVGIRTFSASVYLRSEGGNPGKAQALFKCALSEFKKLAEFEKNIIIFRKVFAVSQYELDNEDENRVVAAQAANRMMQIQSIRASFALTSVGDAVHISARSDGSVNVSLILEKLKGGGHYDAAGAKLTGVTIRESLTMLRDAIVEYCDKA